MKTIWKRSPPAGILVGVLAILAALAAPAGAASALDDGYLTRIAPDRNNSSDACPASEPLTNNETDTVQPDSVDPALGQLIIPRAGGCLFTYCSAVSVTAPGTWKGVIETARHCFDNDDETRQPYFIPAKNGHSEPH